MMKPNRRLVLALLLLWPVLAPAAEGDATLRWDRLSREEQQVLKPWQDRWDSLSPERRERLQQGARRWQAMTPEQREEFRERWRRENRGPGHERGMSPGPERPGWMGPR